MHRAAVRRVRNQPLRVHHPIPCLSCDTKALIQEESQPGQPWRHLPPERVAATGSAAKTTTPGARSSFWPRRTDGPSHERDGRHPHVGSSGEVGQARRPHHTTLDRTRPPARHRRRDAGPLRLNDVTQTDKHVRQQGLDNRGRRRRDLLAAPELTEYLIRRTLMIQWITCPHRTPDHT